MTIADLPIDDRPRERLLSHGGKKLSSAELLAIVLGKGTRGKSALELAYELLTQFKSLSRLLDASLSDLCQIKGMGQAKALQLKATLEIGYRMITPHLITRYPVRKATDCFFYIRDRFDEPEIEQLLVIARDGKGQAFAHASIAMGKTNVVAVNIRDILTFALRQRATSIIVCHNHPTGDPTPSKEDLDLTIRIEFACKAVGIPLDDHLVFSRITYTSLYAEGILSKRPIY